MVRTFFAVLALVLAALPVSAEIGEDVRAVTLTARNDALFPRSGHGALRTHQQLIWDSAQGRLTRRSVTVFDPFADAAWDLHWEPRRVTTLTDRPVSGEGILTWRRPGAAHFLHEGVVAQFRGRLEEGRTEGPGVFLSAAGARYDGDWRGGLMHGQGVLRAPNGTVYQGAFRDGAFDGTGVMISATGEVFDGRFAAGLRDGPGRLQRPDGTRFASVWRAGVEVPDQRSGVPEGWAQLWPVQARTSPRGLAVPVGTGGPVQFCCGLGPSKMRYTSASRTDRITIFPDLPDLLSVWRGTANVVINNPLSFDWDRAGLGEYTFLNLSDAQNAFELPLRFGLENRSGGAVQIVGGYLEFDRSRVDRQPAIQALELKPLSAQNIEFSIENFGWSQATEVTLDVSFVGGGVQTMPLQIAIGTVDGVDQFSFEPALRGFGVDVDRLRSTGGDCRSIAGDCMTYVAANGGWGRLANMLELSGDWAAGYGNVHIRAVGTLTYLWTDADGQRLRTEAPFDARVPLLKFGSRAECEGGWARDIDEGRVFEMAEDRRGYRIPFGLNTLMGAGQTSYWEITLDAQKSTIHNLRVVLQLADGREVVSRDVEIQYLRPRSFPAAIRPFEPRC